MDFVRKFLDCEEVQRRDADRERGEYVVQSREVAFAIVCVFVCVCGDPWDHVHVKCQKCEISEMVHNYILIHAFGQIVFT